MSYRKQAMKYGTGATLSALALTSPLAFAAPDGAAIASQIGETNAVVDSAGGAMIGVAVGIMIFAFIIGMILRKGK